MQAERAVVNNEFDRLLAAMAARQDASELLQGLRVRPSQQESVPAEAPPPRARGAGRGSGDGVGIRRTAQPAAKAALQRNDRLPAPRASEREREREPASSLLKRETRHLLQGNSFAQETPVRGHSDRALSRESVYFDGLVHGDDPLVRLRRGRETGAGTSRS